MIDLHAIAERYHRALSAKPSKGPISEAGIAAITDSVCDIPQMLAEIERLRDLTDQDALTREAIRLAEGSALSVSEIVESFKSMRDGEWKRRAVVARERAKAAEAALESWRAAAIENETIADDYRRHAEAMTDKRREAEADLAAACWIIDDARHALSPERPGQRASQASALEFRGSPAGRYVDGS